MSIAISALMTMIMIGFIIAICVKHQKMEKKLMDLEKQMKNLTMDKMTTETANEEQTGNFKITIYFSTQSHIKKIF